MRHGRWSLVAWLLAAAAVPAGAAGPHIEDMTWTELRDRIASGTTTVLVPIGGTEQNGPHMVLGKHNTRVRVLAGRIAGRLGNAVVAPVIAYVPEGSIDPPTGHMRYAGTVTISDATFDAVLASTARSFQRHGFRDVVFLGDHGSYQRNAVRVAAALNREPAGSTGPFRVHALVDYYLSAQTGFADVLKARGFSAVQIGTHAGMADTALALAVDPALVRQSLLGALAGPPRPGADDGVTGDPRLATAELGQLGIDRIVETSVTKIRAVTQAR